MAYLVNVTARAMRDLADIYDAIHADSSRQAFRWFNELIDAIYSLEQQPKRGPITPEGGDLRHLLYGKKPHVYRIIYRIHERKQGVNVLHIRNGARDAFQLE